MGEVVDAALGDVGVPRQTGPQPAVERAGRDGAARWRRPLPPVEQVRPGLWSIPVPLPWAKPAHVFVYVFETSTGPFLMDAGWDFDEAFDELQAGLAMIGMSVADVRGVVVTHAHLDHYGLANRIREASGAWVSLHRLDEAMLRHFEHGYADRISELMIRAGAPAEMTERLLAGYQQPAPGLSRPDILLEDGDRPDIPGWDLTALWTPGHSPGHLCFWEPTNRLLFSGDHVLPSTAVGVSAPEEAVPDPLGDYLRSLARLRSLPAEEVLPAHEYRFTGLERRLAELDAHHAGRLSEVVEGLRAGASRVWDVAGYVTWHRPFRNLRGVALQNAVMDTMSYLATLEATGAARSEPGTPDRWRLIEP
ncbi:Zn-dependent hydrolase, glyoxylase [Frankia casuarinae]|uniref:Beta-lactamase-like n=1 Tax=Frankia casuarinae (strain DSM 45818 / CECT 9043 / HFP020203 / CcI3) TaxID=106370 RepID=Q2J8G9_FRACC|nr:MULTISPECIES: MBL fold metallo-hydrolase [Frankia]KDA44756.1 Zn-dependent hydrolase, glyoxylase [Frankia sp. BMG5.23]KEZ36604.1 Zn-dependent hydrolase, glyoxylase [Frankia sp. CeD]ABD12423.1 beta-lactamase-like [Frankia casuarinae]ETA01493.1 Zn-dependent hydrolase, glyoxylase [Frankia sp. CcI6]EYT91999.1 Zn-dependent hydrolase, glyoxylase [Frankia casuarinae]